MGNWLVYPYHESDEWIFQQNYKQEFFDSLQAVVTSEEKIMFQDSGKFVDEKEFEENIEKSTGLWIAQSRQEIDFYKYILPKIESAVEKKKKIFCTRSIEDKEKNVLGEMIPDQQYVINFSGEIGIVQKNTIFDIDVPVILLIGTSEKINNVRQILNIQHVFEDKGYKIEVFSDAKEMLLYRHCHWLSMFSEKERTNAEKILLANHYIKQIEVEQSPEVILIGIIAGASTFGNEYVEDFGVTVYSIAQGVPPDCTVLNVMFGYNQNELELLGKETANIVGENIDFYNIRNKVLDIMAAENENEVCTITIDEELVRNDVVKLKSDKVYYAGNNIEYERLVDAIIDKLSGYADIISI